MPKLQVSSHWDSESVTSTRCLTEILLDVCKLGSTMLDMHLANGMNVVSHEGLTKKIMRSKYPGMLTDLEVSVQ